MSKYFYENAIYDDAAHVIPSGALRLSADRAAQIHAALKQGKAVTVTNNRTRITEAEPDRARLLELAVAKIDAATDAAILTGFAYGGSSFYLSIENQLNYQAEYELRYTRVYPRRLRSADGWFESDSPAAIADFYAAMRNHISAQVAAGVEKKAAAAAMTAAALQELLNE
ncbi:MAG: hypothetical protein AB7F40_05610 [Victivallaceae bacterium]